jgi:addiction module RelE/StbE family toxin
MATKQYKIKYLPSAQADMLGIFEYISPVNLSAAENLLDAFDNQISNLGSLPRLGKMIDDYELNLKGFRVLVVENYYVFYIIHEDEALVKVYRVLSCRQDYLQWLNNALLVE